MSLKRHSVRTDSSRVMALLAARYCPPAYAFFQEVGDSVGFQCKRHADAVALSLWPSRGLSIIGIEVKVARGDWLKELRDPEKAEAVMSYCDEWWIAAPDGVVDPAELPKTWGLMVAKDGALKTHVVAPRLTPKPLTREFMAAILRRSSENTVPKCSIDDKVSEAYERGHDDGLKSAGTDRDWKLQEADRAVKRLKEFEEKSGIKIDEYDAGHVGEKFALFQSIESYHGITKWLGDVAEQAQRFERNAREALEKLGTNVEVKP